MLAYCKKHNEYTGKGRPKLPCEACWALWFCKHDYILEDDLPAIRGISVRNLSD